MITILSSIVYQIFYFSNKSKDPRDTRAKSRDGQTSSQLLQKSAGATKTKPDNNLR